MLPEENDEAVAALLAAGGVTEFVYQPAGPDLERELRAFAQMAGISPS